MAATDLPIEFHSETDAYGDKLRRRTRDQLLTLRGDHSDLVGAAVTVEEIAKSEVAFRYEFTVVAYMRPDRLVASKKAGNVRQAMKEALAALERQVRERRAKLKEHWKRPDLANDP